MFKLSQIWPKKALSIWLYPFDVSPSFFTHSFNVLAQSGVHGSSGIFFTSALESAISQGGPSSWAECSWVGIAADQASKLRMMDMQVREPRYLVMSPSQWPHPWASYSMRQYISLFFKQSEIFPPCGTYSLIIQSLISGVLLILAKNNVTHTQNIWGHYVLLKPWHSLVHWDF